MELRKSHVNTYEKKFQEKRTASEESLSLDVCYYPKNRDEGYEAEIDYSCSR